MIPNRPAATPACRLGPSLASKKIMTTELNEGKNITESRSLVDISADYTRTIKQGEELTKLGFPTARQSKYILNMLQVQKMTNE